MKKTSVSIDPELWKVVGKAAIDRGVDKSTALNAGLRLWLGTDAISVLPSPKRDMEGPEVLEHERELVNDLLKILRSGDDYAVSRVKSDIDIGLALLEAHGAHGGEKKRGQGVRRKPAV